ncbi:MAG: DegT/DnrJ/EryC1/StrS family aminotransferase [Anaerolineae bacterium]|nr:DegT/DnrJ/EryC1/StrS family aminotransferase [Anaerolineae bacterium]
MHQQIPLADIDLGPAEIEAVAEVLKSKWLTMGEVTQQFETAFAKYIGVKHAFAVSNCTAALHIAQQVLGVTTGDEVICPSLTFVATANAILYTGATPVFADVAGYDDLNISPDSISDKITPNTKAITVVHYAGYPCDMDRIVQIANEHNLYIIEDVAHAPGATLNGKSLGTFGDIGCFSFFSNKNMTTGEGGMIVTDNDDLAEKIRRIRSHGMTSLTWDRHKGHAYSYDVVDLGYNYRLDEMRAAMGLVQLQKLERNNSLRKDMVAIYQDRLVPLEEITVPFSPNYRGNSSYHIFPILLQAGINSNQFRAEMKERGIQTSMHYPPIHLFSYYREKFGYAEGMLPFTEEISRREVTLPLFPSMGAEAIEYIVEAIKALTSAPVQVSV